jgi:phosphatidylserine/phosphatidylglycerophosphate/cardiolipin synthase-like enzyme
MTAESMSDWGGLASAAGRASATLPPEQVTLLAQRAATHATPATARSIGDQPPTANFRNAANAIVAAWQNTPNPPNGPVIAGMLLAAAAATASARAEQKVDLVWTGPDSKSIRGRATSDVIVEVIDTAKQSLVLCTFASRKVDRIRAALQEAVARGVSITLILENENSNNAYKKAPRDPFHGIKAEVLEWPAELREPAGGWSPALHAKFVLADDSTLFITSANLTGFALDRNIEAGLLLQGGPIPGQFRDHLRDLAYGKVLTAVDPA